MGTFMKSFSIPKKKKIVETKPIAVSEPAPVLQCEATFEECEDNDNFTRHLADIVQASYAEQRAKNFFEVRNVHRVRNRFLEKKLEAFKKKVRSAGHTDIESYGFLLIGFDKEDYEHIANNGYAIATSFYGDIGDSKQGVYVYKNADLVSPAPAYRNLVQRIICFRTVRGRPADVGLDSRELNPSPIHFSHVAQTKHGGSRLQRHRQSAVFHYELNDVGSAVEVPGGVVPYAVFDLAVVPKPPKRIPPLLSINPKSSLIDVASGKLSSSSAIFPSLPFTMSLLFDHESATKASSLNSRMMLSALTSWEAAMTHPCISALTGPEVWGRLIAEPEIVVQNYDTGIRWIACHHLFTSSAPEFSEYVDAFRVEKMVVIGYSTSTSIDYDDPSKTVVKTATCMLIPSGEMTIRLGFPWIEKSHLHMVIMKEKYSVLGNIGNRLDLPVFEREQHVAVTDVLHGNEPDMREAIEKIYKEHLIRFKHVAPKGSNDNYRKKKLGYNPDFNRSTFEDQRFVQSSSETNDHRFGQHIEDNVDNSPCYIDGYESPDMPMPPIPVLPPPSKGCLRKPSAGPRLPLINGRAPLPNMRYLHLGNVPRPRRGILWADSCGKLLENWSSHRDEHEHSDARQQEMRRKDLELEHEGSRAQTRKEELAQPTDMPTTAFNNIFKNGLSSISSIGAMSSGTPINLAPIDLSFGSQGPLVDKPPLKMSKISSLPLPKFSYQESSKVLVDDGSRPYSPPTTSTGPPTQLANESLTEPSGDDMDIDSDHEENDENNKSPSYIEDQLEEYGSEKFVDPHDKDYNELFSEGNTNEQLLTSQSKDDVTDNDNTAINDGPEEGDDSHNHSITENNNEKDDDKIDAIDALLLNIIGTSVTSIPSQSLAPDSKKADISDSLTSVASSVSSNFLQDTSDIKRILSSLESKQPPLTESKDVDLRNQTLPARPSRFDIPPNLSLFNKDCNPDPNGRTTDEDLRVRNALKVIPAKLIISIKKAVESSLAPSVFSADDEEVEIPTSSKAVTNETDTDERIQQDKDDRVCEKDRNSRERDHDGRDRERRRDRDDRRRRSRSRDREQRRRDRSRSRSRDRDGHRDRRGSRDYRRESYSNDKDDRTGTSKINSGNAPPLMQQALRQEELEIPLPAALPPVVAAVVPTPEFVSPKAVPPPIIPKVGGGFNVAKNRMEAIMRQRRKERPDEPSQVAAPQVGAPFDRNPSTFHHFPSYPQEYYDSPNRLYPYIPYHMQPTVAAHYAQQEAMYNMSQPHNILREVDAKPSVAFTDTRTSQISPGANVRDVQNDGPSSPPPPSSPDLPPPSSPDVIVLDDDDDIPVNPNQQAGRSSRSSLRDLSLETVPTIPVNVERPKNPLDEEEGEIISDDDETEEVGPSTSASGTSTLNNVQKPQPVTAPITPQIGNRIVSTSFSQFGKPMPMHPQYGVAGLARVGIPGGPRGPIQIRETRQVVVVPDITLFQTSVMTAESLQTVCETLKGWHTVDKVNCTFILHSELSKYLQGNVHFSSYFYILQKYMDCGIVNNMKPHSCDLNNTPFIPFDSILGCLKYMGVFHRAEYPNTAMVYMTRKNFGGNTRAFQNIGVILKTPDEISGNVEDFIRISYTRPT